MRPLPSSKDSTGLAAIIEPAIEGAIVRKHSQLAALSRSITEAAKPTSPAFDVPTAELLLARIEVLASGARDRQPRSSSSGPDEVDRGDDEPHPPDTTRLYALAPSLTRALGEQQAAVLAEGLDDDKLRTVEGLAYSGDLTVQNRASSPRPAVGGDPPRTGPITCVHWRNQDHLQPPCPANPVVSLQPSRSNDENLGMDQEGGLSPPPEEGREEATRRGVATRLLPVAGRRPAGWPVCCRDERCRHRPRGRARRVWNHPIPHRGQARDDPSG